LISGDCISRRGAENAEKRTLLFKRNRQYQAEGTGRGAEGKEKTEVRSQKSVDGRRTGDRRQYAVDSMQKKVKRKGHRGLGIEENWGLSVNR